MIKSYEAIYDHGQIEWLNEKPLCEKARIVIVVDDQNQEVSKPEPNGKRFVALAKQLAQTGFADKFGDPLQWQISERQDRLLEGTKDGV